MKVVVKRAKRGRPVKVHPSLSRGKVYEVIGIEADWYRLLNDHKDPCLYPPRMFQVVEKDEPADWITTYGEEGERYAYPPQLGRIGFFEDFHDRVPSVIEEFWRYMRSRRSRALRDAVKKNAGVRRRPSRQDG